MVSRIGVNATTSVQAGRSNPGVPSGRFQIGGITAAGPTVGSTVVRSLAQYVQVYGPRSASSVSMYDAAQLFFEEGGGELVVTRVVGPNAMPASVDLQDRADTPLTTLRVQSVERGLSNLSVRVTDQASTYTLEVLAGTDVVERWAGLTTSGDAAAIATGSDWVTVTGIPAATPAPNNKPKAGTYPLTGGTDDRAAVDTAVIATALHAGGTLATGGAVAMPGWAAADAAEALVPVAKAHRQVALLATTANATPVEAQATADNLTGMQDGDHAGLFYPWVVVPDGARRRLVDPTAYVAAARSRAHTTTGYWRVPAGEQSRVEWAVDTAPVIDVETNDVLAGHRVNGLTTIYGVPRLYGWQSLSLNPELGLLSARDTLNSLVLGVERVLEPFVFGTIDGRGHFTSAVEAVVTGVLSPVADAGGLYARVNPAGDVLDPGYRVTVDATNNNADTLARNELYVTAAVRLSPTAQLIYAEVVKVALGSTL